MKIIEKICELLSAEDLKKSGTAFFSNHTTLRKGKYMIIGLNPGGDSNAINTTIGDSLKNGKFYDNEYNAYYESWLPDGREHRLQKNLKSLFCYLDDDLKSVCATNLIFERSINEQTISVEKIEKYQKIIELILQEVNPEVLIVFGQKPLTEIKKHYKIDKESVCYTESGHGKWRIELIKSKEVKIIGLPHLSRYVLYSRKEVLQQLKNFIEDK